MKALHVIANTKEEAIKIAARKFGVDEYAVKVVGFYNSSSDLLDGAAPLENSVSITIDEEYLLNRTRDHVSRLLELMGLAGEIRASLEGNIIKVKLHINYPSILIGYKGENLDAFQHLINRMINRGEKELPIVIVDVQRYREKRIEELDKIATRAALSVIKYKKEYALLPMSTEERKIIHNKVKEYPQLVSYSRGKEEQRCVVIDLAVNVKDNIAISPQR